MERHEKLNLAHLHKLHLQLKEVQDQLERGPRLMKAREQLTLQKQADLEAQKLKQKTLKMAADQKALQLKSNESKIQDLRGKLNSANSNREFDIFKSQIEADTVANSVLEDEILDSLEKVDAAQIGAKKLEAEVAAAKAEEVRGAAEIAAAQPGLQAKIAEVQAELAAAEAYLPGEITLNYRRLVQAHGAAAMAEVNGSICTSCYVSLPPQMVVTLKSGHVMFCKTCARLLYIGEEEEE